MVASQSIARDLVSAIARRRQAASLHCVGELTNCFISSLPANKIFLRSIFLPKFFVTDRCEMAGSFMAKEERQDSMNAASYRTNTTTRTISITTRRRHPTPKPRSLEGET
jgi:hypothetical protein